MSKTKKKEVRAMRDWEMVALIQRGGRDGAHLDRKKDARRKACRGRVRADD